jgi:hypothetical protein
VSGVPTCRQAKTRQGIFSADGPPDVERLTTSREIHHHFRPDLEQRLMDKHNVRVIGT